MSSMWTRENQDFEKPVVITCALSGVMANRNQCAAIPYTPEEYAAEAKRAYEAGASVVHIHARKTDGSPSYEISDYKAIKDAINAACPINTNFSTGAVGLETERKIAPVRELLPDIGALNMGSMNYAKYNQKKKDFVFQFVFQNPFSEIIELVSEMKKVGVRPEMECFDAGHIGNSFPLIDLGLISPPYQYSFILGVVGGMPPTIPNLLKMVDLLPPQSEWEVIGISLDQWRLIAGAIAIGGNIRVGLEDNFYLSEGKMAGSNGDLVAKAAQMVRDQGRAIATVEQARERLGLTKK